MNPSTESRYNLLLEMDALIDTRMGTLVGLVPDISKSLHIRDYRTREQDDWTTLTNGIVTTEQFDEAYAKRNIDTLKRSFITGVVPMLIQYLDGLEERYMRRVDITEIKVDLNLYPYTLPGPVSEMFKNCLSTLLPSYAVVNTVRVNPLEWSPSEFLANYNGWLTYDFHTWLGIHHEALLHKPVNGLAVILPRLLKEPREMSDENIFKGTDLHGLFEMVMEDFIHLEHLDIDDYCYIMPGTYKLPEGYS